MKFQRDNTNVALTQEMKDAVIKERKEKEKTAKDFMQKKRKQRISRDKAEREYAEQVIPIEMRKRAYPRIGDQLDMLFHDMESGYITVDKEQANTWYQTIKRVKEQTPLSETWREDLVIAHHELVNRNSELANNSNESV